MLEADAPRVTCRVHAVVVASVPWARHGAGHTYAFDETAAWLATQSSKSTVTALMRIAWRTVGSIITRVWADVDAGGDRLDGLRRIGIDEISYKKGDRDRRRAAQGCEGGRGAQPVGVVPGGDEQLGADDRADALDGQQRRVGRGRAGEHPLLELGDLRG